MKSITHLCPFCVGRLEIYPWDDHTVYCCIAEDCINDDMPRYKAYYNNYPTRLISREFMIDKYYIQVSYLNNTTTVSILVGCMLMDSIEIKKLFPLDFDDLGSYLEKIKTILVLS